jgi:hypothetical protein
MVDPYVVPDNVEEIAAKVAAERETYHAPLHLKAVHGENAHVEATYPAHVAPSPQAVYPAPAYNQPYVAPAPVYPTAQPAWGAPGYQPGYPYAPAHRATDGMSIAALACGIAGLVGALPFIGPVLALIFGLIGLRRTRENGTAGRGMSIAGIAIGAAGILLSLLFALWALALFAGNWHSTPSTILWP